MTAEVCTAREAYPVVFLQVLHERQRWLGERSYRLHTGTDDDLVVGDKAQHDRLVDRQAAGARPLGTEHARAMGLGPVRDVSLLGARVAASNARLELIEVRWPCLARNRRR